MKIYDDIGIQVPRVLLPRAGTNLTKWAVIACDQFTSQPEYWQKVEGIVGQSPSTLHLILPEVYLEQPGVEEHIQTIQARMHEYLARKVLVTHDGLIYVERSVNGRTRRGLMLCLDLEHYDFTKGSTSLIRATEGTIVERLPPRMKIRTGAPLELPHILVLIDDPGRTVLEPLSAARDRLAKLYDFELMQGSGHLRGFSLGEVEEAQVVAALRKLAEPHDFVRRYGLPVDTPVLLFAMGDGNHSLASAKAVWERMKPEFGLGHPARYALVEVENLHDEGLEFEPIHRVLFGLQRDLVSAIRQAFDGQVNYTPVEDAAGMVKRVDGQNGPAQEIGLVGGGQASGFGVLAIHKPCSNLPVGTLQSFLDIFLKEGGAKKIDYVHGEGVVCSLGALSGNAGFYVPGMAKSDLFKTVLLDGALPRKTFSMGEAHEKRFYMECRQIAG